MSTAGAGLGTGAVLLCAGGGSRFVTPGSEHKLLAPFRGKPLVSWALEQAVAAGLDATIVVTGAVDLAHLVPAGVARVDNPAWRDGIATSLQCAIGEARRLGLGSVVVGLGDQPLVPAAAWRAVASSAAPVAVATYAGARRNPVRLASEVWGYLPISGDEGARALMRARPDLVAEVPCPGDPFDADTVQDFARR